jgi:hypothetical protein
MAHTQADTSHGGPSGPDNPAVRHEESDVNIRAILGFGLGLIVTAVAIHLLVWLLFQYFTEQSAAHVSPEYPLAIGSESRQPPEPRLQTAPRDDLRALRAHEDELLTSYGWIDKPAGIVRIPIDEAMRITLQRGLPARPNSREQR